MPARLTAPPGISGVRAVALPDGTASVQWGTGRKADGQVEFGSSAALGEEGLDSGVGTAHQVELTQLGPGLRYYYRVNSTTPWGTPGSSPVFALQTPAYGVADSRRAQWRDG